MIFFSFLLLAYTLRFASAASSDPACEKSCSDYSISQGYCRSIYGNLPGQKNYTFANDFISCMCNGSTSTGAVGNDSFLASIGICESCEATPERIQKDLSDLLDLCAIQKDNGTAAGALIYMPVGYSTTNNPAFAAVEGGDGFQRASFSSKGLVGATVWFLLTIWSIM